MVDFLDRRREEADKVSSLTPADSDQHPQIHGVLLSDEIEYYVWSHNLISPFDRNNLKPAGYELTFGNEFFISGEFVAFDPSNDAENTLTISPFEVAVLKTREILCLPRFLIARWNIRVKLAYKGLLWVGGPQVDPGWVGFLFCPIYNLSDKPISIRAGEAIALMDFVKTTPFNKNKLNPPLSYPPAKRKVIEDYPVSDLRSALFTEAALKLAKFELQMGSLSSRFDLLTTILFAVLGTAIAAIALLSRANIDNVSLAAAFFGALTIAMSSAALLFALFSMLRAPVERGIYEIYGRLRADRRLSLSIFLRRAFWVTVVTSSILCAIVGKVIYSKADKVFQEITQQYAVAKPGLGNKASSVELNNLSARLSRIESRPLVSLDDLVRLKKELESEIRADKPGSR